MMDQMKEQVDVGEGYQYCSHEPEFITLPGCSLVHEWWKKNQAAAPFPVAIKDGY